MTGETTVLVPTPEQRVFGDAFTVSGEQADTETQKLYREERAVHISNGEMTWVGRVLEHEPFVAAELFIERRAIASLLTDSATGATNVILLNKKTANLGSYEVLTHDQPFDIAVGLAEKYVARVGAGIRLQQLCQTYTDILPSRPRIAEQKELNGNEHPGLVVQFDASDGKLFEYTNAVGAHTSIATSDEMPGWYKIELLPPSVVDLDEAILQEEEGDVTAEVYLVDATGNLVSTVHWVSQGSSLPGRFESTYVNGFQLLERIESDFVLPDAA